MEKTRNNELNPEPILCNGVNDWDTLTALRDGMFNNLSQTVTAELEQNGGTITDKMEKWAVFDAIKGITQYRERYLIRRINQLERSLGLATRDYGNELSPVYYAGNTNN